VDCEVVHFLPIDTRVQRLKEKRLTCSNANYKITSSNQFQFCIMHENALNRSSGESL